jgi:hypothetical protein
LQQNYYSCKCIEEDLGPKNDSITLDPASDQVAVVDAVSGLCSFQCQNLLPFLCILFFITLLTSLNQMPMICVTLRSVSEIEKPFALGLQLVIMRLLGKLKKIKR